jgi:hypothetical protein
LPQAASLQGAHVPPKAVLSCCSHHLVWLGLLQRHWYASRFCTGAMHGCLEQDSSLVGPCLGTHSVYGHAQQWRPRIHSLICTVSVCIGLYVCVYLFMHTQACATRQQCRCSAAPAARVSVVLCGSLAATTLALGSLDGLFAPSSTVHLRHLDSLLRHLFLRSRWLVVLQMLENGCAGRAGHNR